MFSPISYLSHIIIKVIVRRTVLDYRLKKKIEPRPPLRGGFKNESPPSTRGAGLFILPFLHKKTPNWLIIIIILAILILYKNPFNIVDYILNINNNYVLIFFIIAQFTLCIEYFIYLILIDISNHNKIILSNNLPKFINNKLLHFNNLSKNAKGFLFKDYKFMIKVYLSIILFEVIVICLGII